VQARILDGDGRLGGEGTEEADLLLGEVEGAGVDGQAPVSRSP
jgi:hypothetical protein